MRDQIFKFKLRCFNILYYYYNIYNTKKFFIKFVKIVLIYNLQKKISYIIRKSQILKFVYIKNKSFKNLRISFLCKLRLYKDRFLIHSTRICVYIILILKFNVNSFLYTYIQKTFSSKRNKNIAFNKIKYFCCCLLK